MIFGTKRDSFLLILFSSNHFLFVLGLLIILTTVSFNQWLNWIGWLILFGALVLWITSAWFISYIIDKDYLIIRKGLFIKRIKYDQLIEVKDVQFRLADLLNGERALGSKDGLILFYQTKLGIKKIKLSPKDKDSFVMELIKQVPKIKMN